MAEFCVGLSQEHSSLKRCSAFTLLEVMVSVALLGIILATVGPNFGRSSLSTKGTALALAAALTEARQQAITMQVPVALVIPSEGGTQGQADSYYIATGEQPRVTQVRRLGDEQTDLRLMVGHWPLDTGKLHDPTLTTTVTPPPEATWENDFAANLWPLPAPKDYAFIFTPRGKLVSNGLPHFDGAYHIIVSHGGRSTAAVASGTSGITDPPATFSPTEVGSPYTVSITPTGAVSVMPGVVGAPDGASYIKAQAALISPPSRPVLDPPPSTVPTITSLSLLPDPAKLRLPAGVGMLLAPDRHMTMTVRAKSPEGAPLFCQWKVTDGGLSSPQQVRASYLPATQEWESVWQWRIPSDADPGDQFTLEGVVKDAHGNEAPVGLGAGADPVEVEVGDPSVQAIFQTNRDGNQELYRVNTDGTGLTNLTQGPSTDYMLYQSDAWSPDGERVLFSSNRGGNPDIYLMNADGTGQTRLTNDAATEGDYRWSPSGAQIAFVSDATGNKEVYVMNADGSGKTNLTNSSWTIDFAPVWSATGQQVAYVMGTSTNYDTMKWLCIRKPDGTGLTYPASGIALSFPAWLGNSTKIAFAKSSDLYVVNSDGSGHTNLTSTLPTGAFAPRSSPDGTRIAYTDLLEVYVLNADGTGHANLSNMHIHPVTTVTVTDQVNDWAADKIAFLSNRDGNYEIYLASPDGSNLFNLTQDSADEFMCDLR
jgi:TolB protein